MKKKNKNYFKSLSRKRRGKSLRVSISDEGKELFSSQVNTSDQKKVDQVFDDLEAKGIKRSKKKYNTGWLDP